MGSMLPLCVHLLISSHQVKTRDSRKIPRPIPRRKLAYEVAKKLRAFLKVSAVSSTGLHNFDVTNAVSEEETQARRNGLPWRRGGIP